MRSNLEVEMVQPLAILNTPPEERFDRYTRLAKCLFRVPIAVVRLANQNRPWLKSCQDKESTETTRAASFCGHAIKGGDLFEVSDASQDHRFVDNSLVVSDPHIRFYAGYPIRTGPGNALGTFCLFDKKPRSLTTKEKQLFRDLGDMVARELEVMELASLDDLTGLSNRRIFMTLAQEVLSACRRNGRLLTLLFFDLDKFKSINDRFGHSEGDRALREAAQLLRDTFRDSDVIGRLGGDEFGVLISGACRAEAESMVSRLEENIWLRNRQFDRPYHLEYSAGVVQFDPARHRSLDQFIGEADQLMYKSKTAKDRK